MLPVFESSTGLICDSLESSITDFDQRICPTVMQSCANVTSEACEDAFHQPEEAQQLFACPVSDETVQDKIWNQKGSLNTATFRRELQNRLDADSVTNLVVFGQQAADTTAEFYRCCVTSNVRILCYSPRRAPVAD